MSIKPMLFNTDMVQAIQNVGTAVDKSMISKEAKERFKRPAYQGTQIEAKSYKEHLMDRFMEVK